MATFTPPVASEVTPRFDFDAEGNPVETSTLQRAPYKYMRPLDVSVNVYVMSDGTVLTTLPVPIAGGLQSTAGQPLPDTHMGSPFGVGSPAGPPEGAEGGPFGPPPAYAAVQENVTGVFTEYALSPYLTYYFLGSHSYPGISANLVSILTAAGFGAYIT